MTLTGKVQGNTRQELTQQARKEASSYYGHTCLKVTLHRETADTNYVFEPLYSQDTANATATRTNYTADYEAAETHIKNSDVEKYTNRLNGKPNICDTCGKEYQ